MVPLLLLLLLLPALLPPLRGGVFHRRAPAAPLLLGVRPEPRRLGLARLLVVALVARGVRRRGVLLSVMVMIRGVRVRRRPPLPLRSRRLVPPSRLLLLLLLLLRGGGGVDLVEKRDVGGGFSRGQAEEIFARACALALFGVVPELPHLLC